MVLMYSPHGVPTEVGNSLVKDYLKRNYTRKDNGRLPKAIVKAGIKETFPIKESLPEIPIKKVNLNQASLEELMSLPRVGNAIAQSIVEHRPIQDLETLQEAIPRVDWGEIKERIEL